MRRQQRAKAAAAAAVGVAVGGAGGHGSALRQLESSDLCLLCCAEPCNEQQSGMTKQHVRIGARHER